MGTKLRPLNKRNLQAWKTSVLIRLMALWSGMFNLAPEIITNYSYIYIYTCIYIYIYISRGGVGGMGCEKQVREGEGWGKGDLKVGMLVIEGEKVRHCDRRERGWRGDTKIIF